MVSVLNRSTRRLASAAAVGALGIAIALGTTACSSGKISQTANQEPAINGANGTITLTPSDYNGEKMTNGSIAIRNVHVLYPVDKAAQIFGDGGPFKLAFLISNDSPTRIVKLDSITAKTGTVKMTPPPAAAGEDPTRIHPTKAILAGDSVLSNTDTDGDNQPGNSKFSVELTNTGDTVAAGLTTPLTFSFSVYDLSGKEVEKVSTTITTPVDGGPDMDRQDIVRDVQGGAGH
ncbi:MAG: copper-binding protein [Gordonia sp. (in: high G+C Gram-positive bacteria)]|uniref:copper-binding protein n=1 Tax=Gordonia sp. (in: high G+C Gram-positive bacteria) TaxID=84139 RepID=UPI003C725AD7